jgi:peptide/nickel transport system ATP-binding protein
MENNDAKKPILSIRNLKQYFPVKGRRGLFVRANDGVSLEIYENETLGVVGESGCGKSTLGRTLLQLHKQTDGETIYYGRDIDEVVPKYVLSIYHNLEKKCATTKALVAAAEKMEASFSEAKVKIEIETDNTTIKAEYFSKLNELNETKKNANLEYLMMGRLVGGFYVAKSADYPAITRALEEDFYAAREVKKIRTAIYKVNTQAADHKYKIDNDLGGSQGKYDRAKAKLDQLNSQLEESRARKDKTAAAVDALREKYSGDAEFQKYDALRDKGVDLARLTYEEIRHLRRDLQLIFQDPYSSLNPRLTVGQIISEGPITHQTFLSNNERMQEYTMQVMENCGLASYMIHRYPHQFSGGQRQRIGIARALSVNPKFVVCDEAVSALDVSIQSQIINLLKDLKEKENLTYMFISHDLSVVKYISDRIAVMYLGNIVELCSSEKLFEKPLHPYTEALLSAIPTTDLDSKDKEMIILDGDIPSPVKPPPGCKFNTRCRDCMEICLQVVPVWKEQEPGHFVACHKY